MGIGSIGERKVVSAGWATQSIRLLSPESVRSDGTYVRGLKRGYVKIWRLVDGEWVVVDRALTIERARERIKAMKRAGA